MTFTERGIAQALKQRGLRLTPQRRAVLHAIAQGHEHLTPAHIYHKAREESPGIGLVTVYRTLDMLAELGLLCEVPTTGDARSYILRRTAAHHHHLICADCGAVADFSDCDLGELERALALETGFKIEGHILEFLGRCESCQRMSQAERPRACPSA